MDYGKDLLLVDDDVVFTPDGDIEIISGPVCVAQDIDQTLKTAVGRLPWAKETGSSLPLLLNDAVIDASAVMTELERVAIADSRVDPQSVKAVRKTGKTCRLDFTPLRAVRPEVLEYDLTKGESRA